MEAGFSTWWFCGRVRSGGQGVVGARRSLPQKVIGSDWVSSSRRATSHARVCVCVSFNGCVGRLERGGQTKQKLRMKVQEVT